MKQSIMLLCLVSMLMCSAAERRIFITRHCQATSKGVPLPIKGDAGVTELGVKQAHLLGKELRKLNFKGKIFASPYYRTVATACHAAQECGGMVYPDARVQERVHRDGGNMSPGATLEELKNLFPGEIAPDAKLAHPWLYTRKDRRTDQRERLNKALDEILAENPEGDLLFVIHASAVADFQRIMRERCGDKSIDGFVWNCALFKFAVDDNGKFRFLGYDIGFMPEDEITSNLKDSLRKHKAGKPASRSGVDYKL